MYEEAAPPRALRGVAKCVWRSASEGPKRIVPDGCVDLVLGDGAVFVAGPDTAAWSSLTTPGALLTGVRFHPGHAAAVLGVPADELRDRRVPLDELWDRSAAERLLEGKLSPAEAVVGRLADLPPPDAAVAGLIARLEVGVARVGEAAAGIVGAPAGRRGEGVARAGVGGQGRAGVAGPRAGRGGGEADAVRQDRAGAAVARGGEEAAGAGGQSRAGLAGARAERGGNETADAGRQSPAGLPEPQAGRGGDQAADAARQGRAAIAGAPDEWPGEEATATVLAQPPPFTSSAGAGVRRAEAAAARIEDPALSVAVSERRLRRRFVQAVGYGPATYLRVSRFQRAVALAPHVSSLAALAAAAGYADQAHLSRDCRALTGLTPRHYFRGSSTVDVAVRDRLRSA